LITLVTIVHVVVCIFLILVILLQAGKGGGMGAAFGGAGAQTVFGGRGAQTFLGKVTSACAAIFMITSLTLAYHASHTSSVVKPDFAAPTRSAPGPTGETKTPAPPPLGQPGAPAPVTPAPTPSK
jgi:preprotein translocase subunit SecG